MFFFIISSVLDSFFLLVKQSKYTFLSTTTESIGSVKLTLQGTSCIHMLHKKPIEIFGFCIQRNAASRISSQKVHAQLHVHVDGFNLFFDMNIPKLLELLILNKKK